VFIIGSDAIVQHCTLQYLNLDSLVNTCYALYIFGLNVPLEFPSYIILTYSGCFHKTLLYLVDLYIK
jgi:hypothetical protein